MLAVVGGVAWLGAAGVSTLVGSGDLTTPLTTAQRMTNVALADLALVIVIMGTGRFSLDVALRSKIARVRAPS